MSPRRQVYKWRGKLRGLGTIYQRCQCRRRKLRLLLRRARYLGYGDRLFRYSRGRTNIRQRRTRYPPHSHPIRVPTPPNIVVAGMPVEVHTLPIVMPGTVILMDATSILTDKEIPPSMDLVKM